MLQYSYRQKAPVLSGSSNDQDQRWIDYVPMPERPILGWPGGAKLAVMICPNVLYYELMPPPDPWINPWARMTPDVMMYSRQDFASRVGFWRIVDILDKHALPCTAVLNVVALKKFPQIRDAIVKRKWDLLGHGMYNTRFICGMSPRQERRYYSEMLQMTLDLTGFPLTGMGGPGPQAATENTPDILAELGFLYYSDFFHDDQPFPIRVKSGRLISLPYSLELNDVPVLSIANEADEYVEIAKRQFDRLRAEGGQVLCLAIHPAVVGQAQRAKYVDEILTYFSSFSDVWFATGSEIATHYYDHHYDSVSRAIQERNYPLL